MKFNPNNYNSKDVGSFKVPEPGIYMIKVIDGEKKYTKNGNEMWQMKYEIIQQGNFYGTQIYENIVFSDKTMNRVKLIFDALEINMSEGERDYEYFELIDKVCFVKIEKELYTDNFGNEKWKAKVSFDGYYPLKDKKQKESLEDIPF